MTNVDSEKHTNKNHLRAQKTKAWRIWKWRGLVQNVNEADCGSSSQIHHETNQFLFVELSFCRKPYRMMKNVLSSEI